MHRSPLGCPLPKLSAKASEGDTWGVTYANFRNPKNAWVMHDNGKPCFWHVQRRGDNVVYWKETKRKINTTCLFSFSPKLVQILSFHIKFVQIQESKSYHLFCYKFVPTFGGGLTFDYTSHVRPREEVDYEFWIMVKGSWMGSKSVRNWLKIE